MNERPPSLLEGNKVLLKKDACIQKARNDLHTPVTQLYQQEFAALQNENLDVSQYIPEYSSFKTILCRKRRQALGSLEHPTGACEKAEGE